MADKRQDPSRKKLTGPEVYDFILDVRDGLSDKELGIKYGITGRNFLLHKIAAKDYLEQMFPAATTATRQISAKKVLQDLKSGMDNDALMLKYELSPRQLQKLFRKIIEAGLMSPMDLASRLSVTKSQVTEAFAEVQNSIRELD